MDLIFERFLAKGYEQLDERGRHTFDVLLDVPDQDIYDWLTGTGMPEDAHMAQFVDFVRKHTLEAGDASS